jgi:arabinofuranosyltransferase
LKSDPAANADKGARIASRASWAVLTVLVALILAPAWVCDDAYITMRTVDNAVNGFGLRWNVAERVQTYTHPLWMMSLVPAYWLIRDAYISLMVLSLAAFAAVVAIVWRVALTPIAGVVALALLCLSKSFTDYSTSGLENPLAHALVAAAVAALWSRRARDVSLFLFGSLVALTRLDLALLVAPALAVVIVQRRWSVLPAVAIGALPLLVWEAFSLFYYGFLFPNTAYAKLSTGLPSGELARQGLEYLADSFLRDPVTLATCMVAVVLAAVRPTRRSTPIAAGIVLYLLYIVRIGGDYMSGRFLSVPLLCAVLLICGPDWKTSPSLRRYAVLLLLVIGVLAMAVRLTWPDSDRVRRWLPSGPDPRIIDARGGVMTLSRVWTDRDLGGAWVEMGRSLREENRSRVVKWGAVGFVGFFAGPRLHILDGLALGDPLLARLPVVRPWWPGHYIRREPDGYEPTLAIGTVALTDPRLAAYYSVLREVTRGKLFSRDRLSAVIDMNLRRFDHLLNEYGHLTIDGPLTAQGLTLNFGDGFPTWERGLTVRLSESLCSDRLELRAGENQRFVIRYYRNNRAIGEQQLGAPGRFDPMRRTGEKPSLRLFDASVPPGARSGFDRLDAVLVHGEHPGWLGSIQLGASRPCS